MKKLYALFIAISLISCAAPDPNSKEAKAEVQEKQNQAQESTSHLQVVRYDGCQYLIYDDGVNDDRAYSITHKGNCDNPIHKYEKTD